MQEKAICTSVAPKFSMAETLLPGFPVAMVRNNLGDAGAQAHDDGGY